MPLKTYSYDACWFVSRLESDKIFAIEMISNSTTVAAAVAAMNFKWNTVDFTELFCAVAIMAEVLARD